MESCNRESCIEVLQQWSPTVESCNGDSYSEFLQCESYSGVIQCSVMQWRVLQLCPAVETCSGVLHLSPTVECPAV